MRFASKNPNPRGQREFCSGELKSAPQAFDKLQAEHQSGHPIWVSPVSWTWRRIGKTVQFRYGPAAVTGYETHDIHCSVSLWEGVSSRTIRKSEDLPRINLATGFPGKVRGMSRRLTVQPAPSFPLISLDAVRLS